MDLPTTPHLSAHVSALLNNKVQTPVLRLCRMPDVIAMTGLSIATIYRLIKAGTFPQPRSIGGGMIGFIVAEIEHWILDRPVAVIGTRTKRLRQPDPFVPSRDQVADRSPAAALTGAPLVSPSVVASPTATRGR